MAVGEGDKGRVEHRWQEEGAERDLMSGADVEIEREGPGQGQAWDERGKRQLKGRNKRVQRRTGKRRVGGRSSGGGEGGEGSRALEAVVAEGEGASGEGGRSEAEEVEDAGDVLEVAGEDLPDLDRSKRLTVFLTKFLIALDFFHDASLELKGIALE